MFERICSWDNLLLAYKRAARGKRGRPDVARFEHRLEDRLLELRGELLHGTYRPGEYRSFFVHEPKHRRISAAPFRDRVVHHALCNLLEPILERTFVFETFANRTGKGTHKALDRLQRHARDHRYFLRCDVRQFFPSIDHAILRGLLADRVDDARTLALIDRLLESGAGVLSEEYTIVYFSGDDLFAPLRPRGLPIGNLTSQLWANAYLSPFDHFVKRELRCSGYVRYVDDFVLFADDKAVLRRHLDALVERLGRYRLTIHPGAQPAPVTEGIPFLGFVVDPSRRRLKRRKVVNIRRKLARLSAGHRAGKVSQEAIAASVRGWTQQAGYGNTVGLRKAVLSAAGLLAEAPPALVAGQSYPVWSPDQAFTAAETLLQTLR